MCPCENAQKCSLCETGNDYLINEQAARKRLDIITSLFCF